MKRNELARLALEYLESAEPEMTFDLNHDEYRDELVVFLWRDYLEAMMQDIEAYAERRLEAVKAKIRADHGLEEEEDCPCR